jgi:hypothetical protein
MNAPSLRRQLRNCGSGEPPPALSRLRQLALFGRLAAIALPGREFVLQSCAMPLGNGLPVAFTAGCLWAGIRLALTCRPLAETLEMRADATVR